MVLNLLIILHPLFGIASRNVKAKRTSGDFAEKLSQMRYGIQRPKELLLPAFN
jgi:hypothetical protein